MNLSKSLLSKTNAKKLDPIDRYIDFFLKMKGGAPKRIVINGKVLDALIENTIKSLAKKLTQDEARKLSTNKIKQEGISYRGIPLVTE